MHKRIPDRLRIYIPHKKLEEKPVERLIKLGTQKDCLINCHIVEAILEHLKREERK